MVLSGAINKGRRPAIALGDQRCVDMSLCHARNLMQQLGRANATIRAKEIYLVGSAKNGEILR